MIQVNQPSSQRIVAAFLVAGFADFIQPLLTAMSLTGFLTVPVELIDLLLDGVVCAVLSVLLGGFHWVLAPAFLAEAVPFVDVLPTWTVAVGVVVFLRRRQAFESGSADVDRAPLTIPVIACTSEMSQSREETNHGQV